MIASVEEGLLKALKREAEAARVSIVGTLSKAKLPTRNLTTEDCRAIKSLRTDESILILPADKGTATVVMDKSNYDEKISTMLLDKQTYKKTSKRLRSITGT